MLTHFSREIVNKTDLVTLPCETHKDQSIHRPSDAQTQDGPQNHQSALLEILEVLALLEDSLLHQNAITKGIRTIAHFVTGLDNMAIVEGQISYTVLSQFKALMQQRRKSKYIKFTW
jgi:hypothetical protein